MTEKKQQEPTSDKREKERLPGHGDSLADASEEAVREIVRRGNGHAGTGDIG